MDINIGTLNIRGLNSKEKRSIVYSWIKTILIIPVCCKKNIAQTQTRLSLKRVER